jgi:hypothetical protein
MTNVMTVQQVDTSKIEFGADGTNKYGDQYTLVTYSGGDLLLKVSGACPFGIYSDNIHVNIGDDDFEYITKLDNYFASVYNDWSPILKCSEGYPAHIECSLSGAIFFDRMGKAITRPLTETTLGAEVSVLVHLNNVRKGVNNVGDSFTTLKPRAKQVKVRSVNKMATCLL